MGQSVHEIDIECGNPCGAQPSYGFARDGKRLPAIDRTWTAGFTSCTPRLARLTPS